MRSAIALSTVMRVESALSRVSKRRSDPVIALFLRDKKDQSDQSRRTWMMVGHVTPEMIRRRAEDASSQATPTY
jgi:hypothetical protein